MEQSDELLETQETFGRFVQRSTALTMGSASWPLLAFITFSIVSMIRRGVEPGYLWLGTGAIISGLAMFFFGLASVQRAWGQPKKVWMGLAAAGGFLPYLYSLWVIGYWGLWSVRGLTSAFSVWAILKAGFFVLLGYLFLWRFYRLTELGRKVERVLEVDEKYQSGGGAP